MGALVASGPVLAVQGWHWCHWTDRPGHRNIARSDLLRRPGGCLGKRGIESGRLWRRCPEGHGLHRNQQTTSTDGLVPDATLAVSLAEGRG